MSTQKRGPFDRPKQGGFRFMKGKETQNTDQMTFFHKMPIPTTPLPKKPGSRRRGPTTVWLEE